MGAEKILLWENGSSLAERQVLLRSKVIDLRRVQRESWLRAP